MSFSHVTVLLKETVDGAFTTDQGIYADLTTGGGGHSEELARRLTGEGRLICFDQDAQAIAAAGERLRGYPVTLVQRNFCELDEALDHLVTHERCRSEDEDERDDHKGRLPQFALARPGDALRLSPDTGEIVLRLGENVHFFFPLATNLGRVGGNRTPIGGFGDRCTAIVLLP